MNDETAMKGKEMYQLRDILNRRGSRLVYSFDLPLLLQILKLKKSCFAGYSVVYPKTI